VLEGIVVESASEVAEMVEISLSDGVECSGFD
jgi:hypothetical protein